MLRTILLYGLLSAVAVLILNAIEYWFWVRLHAFEIYAALIAGAFLFMGLWFGKRLSNGPAQLSSSVSKPLSRGEAPIAQWGISKREYDVLVLLGKGLSNQEIADRLFVSQNTIKTHTSRLFEKLEVKNRTQALIKAQEVGLIEPQ